MSSKGNNSGSPPTIVRPVAVSEKSTLENVVNFVTDVVPQSSPSFSDKEQVLWVKFEQLSHPLYGQDDKKDKLFTILMVIGYANGAQIWHMLPHGEVQEVLSLRQGPMKVFSIIHRYKMTELSSFVSEHLIASAEETKPGSVPYCNLKLTTLAAGETVLKIPFNSTINDIHSNLDFLFVTFKEKICAYSLSTLKPAFTITGCFPCEGPNVNPIAVGKSWLAYASNKVVDHVKSHGEVNTDAALTYTASVLNTAKSMAFGMTSIGESLLGSLSGGARRGSREGSGGSRQKSGVVTVINCSKLCELETPFELSHKHSGEGVVCHFQALPQTVVYLKFDSSGTILFTACAEGQNFHIYRLLADVNGSKQASVQHLYVLHRGDTSAQVIDVTFSIDSRWVGVCTARGTTHVFAISPYGGKCTARTHTGQYVVDKSTKYHKSSGLEEFSQPIIRRSATPPPSDSSQESVCKFNSGSLENPHLKKLPTRLDVNEPLAQIKPSLSSSQISIHKHIPHKKISAFFKPMSGRVRRRSHSGQAPPARETLFVLGDNGNLVEYLLDPCTSCEKEKITDTSELRLNVTNHYMWQLLRAHSDKVRTSFNCHNSVSLSARSHRNSSRYGSKESISSDTSNEFNERWLSQVEMLIYSGPNRRLWMGPQFKFKTYSNNSVTVSSHSPALFPTGQAEIQATSDIICETTDLESLQINHQSTATPPITMPSNPLTRQISWEGWKTKYGSGIEDISIEAGSFEPSPHLTGSDLEFGAFEEGLQHPHAGGAAGSHTSNLLADAMQDRSISSESLSSRDLMMFPTG